MKNIKIFLLLGLICIFSYGLTLKMYYWVDDWGLLFKMIHPQSSPGNLGAGVFGQGAYRYLATPFIFLYPLLKLNATAYFALGLFFYILAAFVVYKFVLRFSKSSVLAWVSGIIFSSGYFGSLALYRLSNSYQLTQTTILIFL